MKVASNHCKTLILRQNQGLWVPIERILSPTKRRLIFLRRWRYHQCGCWFKLYSGSTSKSTYIISQSHWEQRTPPQNQHRCCVSYKESKQAMHHRRHHHKQTIENLRSPCHKYGVYITKMALPGFVWCQNLRIPGSISPFEKQPEHATKT